MNCKAKTQSDEPCSLFAEVNRNGFCHVHDPGGEYRKQVEKQRATNRRRRAFSNLERKKIFTAFGPFCYLCLQHINFDHDWHIDHIVPFIAGGSDEMSNLRPVHPICNEFKSDQPLTAGVLLSIREIWNKGMGKN